MGTLIEQLTAASETCKLRVGTYRGLCREAANELTRLRADQEKVQLIVVDLSLKLGKAEAECDRLQEAKRKALAIADERSKENVKLRAEIAHLRAALAAAQAGAPTVEQQFKGAMADGRLDGFAAGIEAAKNALQGATAGYGEIKGEYFIPTLAALRPPAAPAGKDTGLYMTPEEINACKIRYRRPAPVSFRAGRAKRGGRGAARGRMVGCFAAIAASGHRG